MTQWSGFGKKVVSHVVGWLYSFTCVMSRGFDTSRFCSFQMYLNMLFLTLLFIDTGCPSSSSTPASPPSPARPAIFCRSSSSSCAIVFLPVAVVLLVLSSLEDLACEGEDCDWSSLFSLVEVELERMRRRVCVLVSWRREAVRIESMVIDVLGCLVDGKEESQMFGTYCRVIGACSLLFVLLVDYQRWHHRER